MQFNDAIGLIGLPGFQRPSFFLSDRFKGTRADRSDNMTTESARNADLPSRLKAILGGKKLTLRQVSEESARLYGRMSPSYIQHSFYYSLRHGEIGPRLHQLCALSAISGYQLYDWLTVFGFDLSKVPQLQVILPRKRTLVLDADLDIRDSEISWFRDRTGSHAPEGIVPLGRLIEPSRPRHLRSLRAINARDALFAKIGFEDALAFPELLPGSIVRVDPGAPGHLRVQEEAITPDNFYLIEHSRGLWCSRLYLSKNNLVHPLSMRLPFARVDLEIPIQARIHGVVDMEIRATRSLIPAEVPEELVTPWKPKPLISRHIGLGDLLRNARLRSALSLREASLMSRSIADFYGDSRYFIASGSLSDYEAQGDPPRHIHKVVTLCSIYGIQFSDLLAAIGVDSNALGPEPIPRRFMIAPEGSDEAFEAGDTQRSDVGLAALLKEFGEVPYFLRGALGAFSGIKKPSLHDFFWIGANTRQPHPRLRGASLVMIDRLKKKPIRSRSLPLLKQPLYMLLTRDGTYICACCSLEDGYLVVDPHSEDHKLPERLRQGHDAEVVGQVVAIARRLG